jgi:hypothetical protein
MEQEQLKDTVEKLAALAMEAELQSPIDWEELQINEKELFMLMASNVVEQMESVEEEQRAPVALATITKLLVENYVSNLKLKRAVEDV